MAEIHTKYLELLQTKHEEMSSLMDVVVAYQRSANDIHDLGMHKTLLNTIGSFVNVLNKRTALYYSLIGRSSQESKPVYTGPSGTPPIEAPPVLKGPELPNG